MVDVKTILTGFGISPEACHVERIPTGHIHETFRVEGEKSWIIQRVNKNVFRNPSIIASNWKQAAEYLTRMDPGYLFLKPVQTANGREMLEDEEGYPWRLFPYLGETLTIDTVSTPEEAREAAAAFGGLTRRLDGISLQDFRESIPRFHDLGLRFDQFQQALAATTAERKAVAVREINQCLTFRSLVEEYQQWINAPGMPVRLTHNDTKINNVLLDAKTRKARCVIDLDTLMPGYFFYDLGDMVRTFVSPVDENEADFGRIVVRKEMMAALREGYLSEMGSVMTATELEAIPFAGQMMTYIMALRFLADYLNGNVYYHVRYETHNLVRAGNQLTFLALLQQEGKVH